MKASVAVALLCLAMVPLACGGSDSATSADKPETSRSEPLPPEAEPEPVEYGVPRVGSVPQEGPFAAITDGKGNEKPHFDLPDPPAPKKMVVRDIKKGSGPAAKLGDTVVVYYAGAVYATGKVKYYGWPPAPPTAFELGSGTAPELYKAGLLGLRPGGIREVVAPSSMFGGTGAVDYVIALLDVEPKEREP